MRTEEAVTGAGGIPVGYATLAVVYLGLLGAVVVDPAPAGPARRSSEDRRGRRLGGESLAGGRPAVLSCSSASTLYTVLGGADFGAGFWQLSPARGRAAGAIRDHAHHAMAPVWEANHVWLIFVLVVLWTCLPDGVRVDRLDAGDPALRRRGRDHPARRRVRPAPGAATRARGSARSSTVFALSSVLTPFALGAAVGGDRVRPGAGRQRGRRRRDQLAQSDVDPGRRARGRDRAPTWPRSTSPPTRPGCGDAALRGVPRAGARLPGVVAGASRSPGCSCCTPTRPTLYDGLTSGGGLAALVVSVVAGLATLALVVRRRFERGALRGGAPRSPRSSPAGRWRRRPDCCRA